MPTLVNDVKAINKLIKSAHTNSTKFAEILHDAAYNTVFHAINTGDVRPLQALYSGLTPVAQSGLVTWAKKFGPFTFDTKNSAFKVKKDRSHDGASLNAIGPMAYKTPKKASEKHEFNLADEIGKLIAKAQKHQAATAPVAMLSNALKLA